MQHCRGMRTQETAQSDREEHIGHVHLTSDPNSGIRVPVPFKSRTDALLASVVFDGYGVPLHVVDAFVTLLKNPNFSAQELSFSNAEDILSHVSRYSRGLTSICPVLNRETASSMHPEERLKEQLKNSRPTLPEDIVDVIASHLYNERRSFTDLARAQEDAAMRSQGRFALLTPCPRTRDLMSMSLVARAWSSPAQRFLRRSVKAVGSRGLRSILLSPQASASLRELHVVLPSAMATLSEQASDDLREVQFLLRALLKRVPNLEAFYLQTSSPLLQDHTNLLIATGLVEVFAALAGMQSLRCLWLTHIPGRALPSGSVNSACCHLQALYEILPRLQGLQSLWVHNWGEDRASEVGTAIPLAQSSSLRSLSFRLGGNVIFSISPHVYTSSSPLPLFAFARSVTQLHTVAWNLFLPNTRAPSPLFTELTSLAASVASLSLTIDSTTDIDVELLSTHILVPATQLTHLTLILVGPCATLPHFVLPEGLRELHIHTAHSAMRNSMLCSQRRTFATEQFWSDLDKDLCSIVPHAATARNSKPSKLERVVLSIEPTSAMRNEAERGFLKKERWAVEGPPLVPEAMRVCAEREAVFECYRAECPSF